MARTSAHGVANYFIVKGMEERDAGGEFITHLKLQKLLYFAQAWFMALFNGERLFDESLEAWVHGPVCREVFDQLKGHGFKPIVRPYAQFVEDEETREFLDALWDEYAVFSAKKLEKMTHEDRPWVEARAGFPADMNSNRKINVNLMREVYTQRAAENGEGR